MRTKEGENFTDCWWFVSNEAQGIKIDKVIHFGGIYMDEIYEGIYCEETNQMEEYSEEHEDDESFVYSANTDEIQKYIIPLVYEYSGRVYEILKEGSDKADRTKLYIELMNRVMKDLLRLN